MGTRAQAVFGWEPRLKKVVRGFGSKVSGPVGYDIASFERHYKRSSMDGDLLKRFDFTILKDARTSDAYGTYHLCQIHVEPNGQYRAIMLRSSDLPIVWWIWVFKKEQRNERREIEHAKLRAREWWQELHGG